MLGRTGDYLNAALMALASARPWFGVVDRRYGENIQAYYEHVRENDLLLTHTLINPQANRAVGPSAQRDPYQAAVIVDRNQEGILLRGARMLATIGPIADEILVLPSTVLQARPEDEDYAYAFAIPCDSKGLRFLCRESLDYGRSHFDHPLGSRFDEMDAVAIFDDVLVPWERCFMVGHPEMLTRGRLYNDTGAIVHMTHQVVLKDLAKTEFLIGLVGLICDAIGIERFEHVQEKIAELINAPRTPAGGAQGCGGGRGTEPVGNPDAGLEPAQHGPQLVPERLPAAQADRLAACRVGALRAPDRGRHPG